jgi:hypothetical protein
LCSENQSVQDAPLSKSSELIMVLITGCQIV